jgi:hypothetical protein
MKQMLVTVMMCARPRWWWRLLYVARNNSCHSSRRRTRHARGRYESRHSALSDGLRCRYWWVLHNLLAARRAQSPEGAHVIRIFCKEELYCLLSE